MDYAFESDPILTFQVQSTAPARRGLLPVLFVEPGNSIRMVPDGDLFTLEVTRGNIVSSYRNFRWNAIQKIWWSDDLQFGNGVWYHEIKVADLGKGGLLFSILVPLATTSGEDPDATGGYTARGQAG